MNAKEDIELEKAKVSTKRARLELTSTKVRSTKANNPVDAFRRDKRKSSQKRER